MSDSVILACASCKAKNRIPVSRIKDGAKCGKCGTALPMEDLGKVFAISDATFEREVMGSGLPVLVDCWAPWCGPCRAMAPVLDELARKYQAKVKIVKLNVDENPVTGSRFSITSIPTMLLVKNGQVKDTLVEHCPENKWKLPLNELFELENPGFIQWLEDNWEIPFKRVCQDFDIQGSPERTLSRAVIEDRKGRLFLLEKFPKEKFNARQRVAQTIAHLNTQGLSQALGGERTINKEFLPFFKGNCFQLSPFLDSTGIERPGWLASADIGKHMALFLIQMTHASSHFSDEISFDNFSIKTYIYKLFKDMKKHDLLMYDRYSPFLAFLEQGFMDIHDRLPLQFSHGDFHPLNVIWDHHRIKAVIDWEFLGFKPDIYDSANLVGCAGIENPEGLGMPMVTTFLRGIRAAEIISPEGWQCFPEYVLALRFAWLSEWLRKKDREMLELEAAFMDILIKNMEDLRYIWEIG